MVAKPPIDRSRAMIEGRLREKPSFAVDRAAERLDERGMRRQTLYLPPEVYEQIRSITITERTSQQAFFREAIDLAFAARGLRSWAELSPAGKGKREK
jgi:hypothetical protein